MTKGSDRYELRQAGVELLVSQQLTIVTPFAGGGVVRSESRFLPEVGGRVDVVTYQPVLYAGVTLDLLLPRITVELERAEELQVAVRLGFGI